MNFDKFMNRPTSELSLFTAIADEICKNYILYHGPYYYLHLKDCGDGLHSMIDEVKNDNEIDDFWNYTYIERDRQGCILIRSDKNSISMLLHGEYYFAEILVTRETYKIVYGPNNALLPVVRDCPLSAVEIMIAFGHIENSLQAEKRKKVS
jgi:hypothetical protein